MMALAAGKDFCVLQVLLGLAVRSIPDLARKIKRDIFGKVGHLGQTGPP
jgi:hypothetical protein